MCYSPISITNNKKEFNPYRDRLKLLVPCGKCGECIKQKRDSWFIRTYYEWQDIKKKGGVALFCTLTYNTEHLPIFRSHKFDENGLKYEVSRECFNNDHVTNFFKLLTKKCVKPQLKRYAYENKLKLKDIPAEISKQIWREYAPRYIQTAEKGSKKDRPHYHAVIMFPQIKSEIVAKSLVRSLWDKYYNYGFVDFGKMGAIQDARGLSYVCKYISKDYTFVSDLEELINNFADEHVWFDAHRNYLRYQPKHHQSQGFGLAINDISKDFLDAGKVPYFYQNPKTGAHCVKTIPLPEYNERKLYYVTDENGSYIPTDKGLKVKFQRFRDNLVKRFDFLNSIYLNLINNITPDILFHLNTFGYQGNKYDIYRNITQILEENKVTLKDVAVYQTLYRGYQGDLQQTGRAMTRTTTMLFSKSTNKYCDTTTGEVCSPPQHFILDPDINRKDLYLNLCDNHKFFRPYEQLSQFFDDYRLALGLSRQALFDKQEEERKLMSLIQLENVQTR